MLKFSYFPIIFFFDHASFQSFTALRTKKMSAFSLDEAIKNIRDENAVNQLVGSLEKSLERQGDSAKYANGKSDLFKTFFNESTTTANVSHSGALKK